MDFWQNSFYQPEDRFSIINRVSPDLTGGEIYPQLLQACQTQAPSGILHYGSAALCNWRGDSLRTKLIWLIGLSTTNADTGESSSHNFPVDVELVAEQLGYLNLPLGLLESHRISKPALVLAVLTKADLFA